MTEEEILYTLALTRIPRLNSANQRILLQEMGSATAIFEARRDIRTAIPEASDKMVETVRRMEESLPRAEEELKFICDKKIQCICFNDREYPQRMRECDDAPVALFFKGSCSLNEKKVINMVGTRHCTEYGKDLCKRFIEELAQLCPDVVIVSGLAYGIDIQAHRRALEAGMNTIGVLAHGLDQIYPRIHRDTALAMIERGGLLTEFMSHTNADKVNFIRRNRIVAGISDATVVVESASKGGSLITADIAESYHREVFAFPGSVFAPYSEGCNRLIRNNQAILLQNAEQLVEAMGWEKKTERKAVQLQLFPNLSPEEELLVARLSSQEGMHINQLVVQCNLPVHRVSALLCSLEMKGVVRMLNGGKYRLENRI